VNAKQLRCETVSTTEVVTGPCLCNALQPTFQQTDASFDCFK